MSYLRFTPDEYRTLVISCARLEPGSHRGPAFKRLLAQALRGVDAALAERIARLRPSDLRLLCQHFGGHGGRPSAFGRSAMKIDFTAREKHLLAEACAATPVRFVRPFKQLLVERFRETSPNLARKLAWLSGREFEELFETVRTSL